VFPKGLSTRCTAPPPADDVNVSETFSVPEVRIKEPSKVVELISYPDFVILASARLI